MAEPGRRRLPPGHRAARLVILGALVGALAVGGLSEQLASGVTSARRWGGDLIAYLWAPVLGAVDGTRPAQPAPSPSVTRKPAPKKSAPKPKKPSPTSSRAR